MPDPVKISDLPAISSVQPNDILPVVDAALTQTSKCTASQIAAIGGGPPGDGTVTTGKIAAGAVTYPKIQNVTGDRVLGKTSGASGTVEEIPCTAFARTLLAAADGNVARGLLNESATFTGTTTVNGNLALNGQARALAGTASAPAYSFSGDTNCGIAQLGGVDTISLVTDGVERLRMTNTGMLAPIGSTMYPAYYCRGWLNWSPYWNTSTFGANNISSVTLLDTGYYKMNFTAQMPDDRYSVCASIGALMATNFPVGSFAVQELTVNWFTVVVIQTYADTPQRRTPMWLFLQVFR